MKLALLILAGAALAAAGALTVTVEEAKVRKRKLFYAPVTATVRLGERLQGEGPEDGWYRVSAAGKEGWLHESAVNAKEAKARAGKWEGGTEAAADEVTLAGKGFSEDVERAYRGQHAELDFAAVDRMEKRKVSDEVMLKFMKNGGTLPGEGR